MLPIVLAFIGPADVWPASCPAAVMARAGSSPAQARITAWLSGYQRGAAVLHDDDAVRGKRFECVPYDETGVREVNHLSDLGGREPVSGFEPLTCRLQDGCSAC